jgi:phage shock protein C
MSRMRRFRPSGGGGKISASRRDDGSLSLSRRRIHPDRGCPLSERLRKSRDRVLGGVCGGIAEWLGWDPTLVRILYVVVSVVSIAFPGILIYLILWLIMPPPE